MSPIRRNSVFEVFKVSRFAVIQEEICSRALRSRVMLALGQRDRKKRKVECRLHIGDDSKTMMKSRRLGGLYT